LEAAVNMRRLAQIVKWADDRVAAPVAIAAFFTLLAPVGVQGRPAAEVPRCNPNPKPLYTVIGEVSAHHPRQGYVEVSVTINLDGTVREARIEKSMDKSYDDLAVQSVLRWKFEQPAHACRSIVRLKFAVKS
jgi:TonB family protein